MIPYCFIRRILVFRDEFIFFTLTSITLNPFNTFCDTQFSTSFSGNHSVCIWWETNLEYLYLWPFKYGLRKTLLVNMLK
jgi:hypothetical protein